MIFADPEADIVVVAERGRVAVTTVAGQPLGPQIMRAIDAGTMVVVRGLSGLLCVGSYDRGEVEAIDWKSGHTRWRAEGFRQLHALHMFGEDVVAEGLNGEAVMLDGANGTIRSTLPKLRCIMCDTAGRGLLLQRRSLEYRALFDGPALATFDVKEPFHAAAFADDGAVVAQPGGLVRFVESRTGKERWRFDCGPGSLLGGLGWCAQRNVAFGVRFSRDGEHEPESLLLDGTRGVLVNSTLSPDRITHPVIANYGCTALAGAWRCDIPSLTWEKWNPGASLG